MPDQDEITRVLRVCEDTLRTLAEERRLSDGALGAFVQLSQTVTKEMERRRLGERRHTPRSDLDRRSLLKVPGPSTSWRSRGWPLALAAASMVVSVGYMALRNSR